jgi:hypothetical protein
MGNPSALAGLLLLLGVASSSPVSGQTPGLVDGAYERMSPANQNVARALFDAQAPGTMPAPGRRGGAATRLTLDEIAAHKQGGQPWSRVFQAMKTRGLVHEANLAQIVSRHQRRGRVSVTSAAPTGASTVR